MSDRILPFPRSRGAVGSGKIREGKTRERSCLICGKPQVEAYLPFCSARCKQVDLGRWFNERYRVPSEEGPGEDEGPGERDPGEEEA